MKCSGFFQLTKKVKLSNKVEQIKLPKSGTNVSANTKCTVAGWGKTETRGKVMKKLRMVEVSVIDLNQCKRVWKKSNGNFPNNIVCAGGYKVKQGFCQVSCALISDFFLILKDL